MFHNPDRNRVPRIDGIVLRVLQDDSAVPAPYSAFHSTPSNVESESVRVKLVHVQAYLERRY